ncbi:MAG TPA: thioredoxin domain-containing protein [Candidatus Eremiobacteraceae bacterium]|nr:thioredoxin domain-containing protein [Candidatus Eremiobacteraceae bacterium]
MRSSLNLILILLLACGVATTQSSTAAKSADKSALAPAVNLPSEATVDAFMHATFGYEPDVSWKISSIRPAPVPGLAEVNVILASQQGQQLSRFFVTADGEHAVVGEIIPFGAKPFEPAKKILEKGIAGPSRGPKNAQVTVVEFGDLQCPACKAAQPAIEALIASEPNARFVFQNFPLEMHNWAAKGAAYADCVAQASNDAFWKFIAKTYEAQADITAENADEKLTALADAAGLKGADIAACAATPVAKAHVDASLALGKAVNVTGTPTLFINGRSIGNVSQVPAASLKGLVDFAAKEGAKEGK